MNKIKLGTLIVAFSYTIYHINTHGWNTGNMAILGFLLFAITMDCYQISKEKNRDRYRTRKKK